MSLVLPQRKLLAPPSDIWKPAHYSKPLTAYTKGGDIAMFAEYAMTATRGFKAGEPLKFTDWQRWCVDSIFELNDDGLFRYRQYVLGLPRKNGKSILGTAIALEALFYSDMGSQIYSAARDRNQAKIVYGEAVKQVDRSELLSRAIRKYGDALENRKTGAVYRALSADSKSAQGLGPSLVIFDELHSISSVGGSTRGEEMWAAMKEGSADRAESMVLGITTAGANDTDLLGALYTAGVKNSALPHDDPEFDKFSGFAWWEAPKDADIFAEETWKAANPNLAEGLLSIEDFRASIKQAAAVSVTEFQRYRLNQWVRFSGVDFMPAFYWKEALDTSLKIELGAEICVGFDGSLNEDSTGIVAIDVNTGVTDILYKWEKNPLDENWAVDRDDVNSAVEEMFDKYNVQLMFCDPSYYETEIADWARAHRGKVERIPPTRVRMGPMSQQWKSDVFAKVIKHNGNPRLTAHVMNAIETEAMTPRKEKRGSLKKIDFLMCAILANGARNKHLKRMKNKTRKATIL